MALQRAAGARLSKSPPASADLSRRPDPRWIWRSACNCAAALQTCRGDRAAKVQRPAPAQVNEMQPGQHRYRLYVHVLMPKILTLYRLKIRAHTRCMYMHVFTQKYMHILAIYVHTFSPARCQYLHVFNVNTDILCSSQAKILLLWSHIRAHTYNIRPHTAFYVYHTACPYDIRSMLYVECMLYVYLSTYINFR